MTGDEGRDEGRDPARDEGGAPARSWREAITAAERALLGDQLSRTRAVAAAEGLCAERQLPDHPSLGRDVSYLASLLDHLGLYDTSRMLLEHVASRLARAPGQRTGDAAVRDRLTVALAERGQPAAATQLTDQAGDGIPTAATLANRAGLMLRRGDLAGAAETAASARRGVLPTASEAADAQQAGAADTEQAGAEEQLDVLVLATAVLAEAARQAGRHPEADRWADELEGCTRRLVDLLGDDHPKSLSALVALASADSASAAAAGDGERMARAGDVIAIAAQRISATLGTEHPRTLAALRNLATVEYETARVLGGARRLRGAEALMAAAAHRTDAPHRRTPYHRIADPDPGRWSIRTSDVSLLPVGVQNAAVPRSPHDHRDAADRHGYGPRFLLWVWDRAEGSLESVVSCAEFGAWLSVPGSLVRTMAEQFAAQGMLRIHADGPADAAGADSGAGPGPGSGPGRGPHVQLLPDGAAEARVLQVRRADPAERGRHARTAVLHWIYARGDRRPLRIEGFFDSSEVFFLGETLTRGEISRTLDYLAESGLVTCEGPEFHNGVGSHVALTALGEDAVLDGGVGDFVARQWRATRLSGLVTVADAGTHLDEVGEPPVQDLVRLLRERVPTLAMDEEAREALLATVEALAEHHSRHGEAGEPRRDRQRALVERLRTRLASAPDTVGRQLLLDAVGGLLRALHEVPP